MNELTLKDKDILAEEVMGWHRVETLAGFDRWDNKDGMTGYHREGVHIPGSWDPTNSHDCSELIQAFTDSEEWFILTVSQGSFKKDFRVSMQYRIAGDPLRQEIRVMGKYTPYKYNLAICHLIMQEVDRCG
jgi:hypothetical protein